MGQKYQDLALIVGANLKRLMKENRLTQEGFGEAFGIDGRTVRRWICSGVDSITKIAEIADFFDIGIMSLLGFQ